jgi:hypothetical protein
MKNIKKIVIVASVLFFAQSAFAATWTTVSTTATTGTWVSATALEAPAAPKLVNKTSTWVTLAWDKVTAATGYIVYYSKTSVAATPADSGAKYPGQTDQIPATDTWVVVSGLEPNTPYYFSLVTLDAEGNESNFSDELNVSTDALGALAWAAVAPTGTWVIAFGIESVNPIDTNTISVTFTKALGNDPIVVKIKKVSDSSELVIASVTKDPTSPNKAIVTLTSPLEKPSVYSIDIIAAKDEAGNNIEAWVDWTKEFPTPDSLLASPDLNAAWSWATSTGTVTPDLEAAKTGPAMNIVILAALILSFGLVFFYRRKLIK